MLTRAVTAILDAVPPAGRIEDLTGGDAAALPPHGVPPPAAFLFEIPASIRGGVLLALAIAIAIYLFVDMRRDMRRDR